MTGRVFVEDLTDYMIGNLMKWVFLLEVKSIQKVDFAKIYWRNLSELIVF